MEQENIPSGKKINTNYNKGQSLFKLRIYWRSKKGMSIYWFGGTVLFWL